MIHIEGQVAPVMSRRWHCHSHIVTHLSLFIYLATSDIYQLLDTKPNQQDIEVKFGTWGHNDSLLRTTLNMILINTEDELNYMWIKLQKVRGRKHFRVSTRRVRCEEKVSWIEIHLSSYWIITRAEQLNRFLLAMENLCKEIRPV